MTDDSKTKCVWFVSQCIGQVPQSWSGPHETVEDARESKRQCERLGRYASIYSEIVPVELPTEPVTPGGVLGECSHEFR